MSFPRYPKYKDSGVAWLGKLPEHWEVARLKRAARVFPSNIDKKSLEGESPVRLCNYTDVYYNDTISPAIDFMQATASSDQIAKFTLRAGDTVITKDSETADDIAVGAYVPDDLPGVVCGYHLSVVRPVDGYSGAFIKWLFDSAYVKSSVAVLANGLTRVGLGQYALDNIELPFPPPTEQGLLARFLDGETAKIDALILQQQQLILLLKEKRQAVISHAVTKGLNPDAPVKASGVAWFGDVPAHWNVVPLGGVCTKIGSGKTPLGGAESYVGDGVLFVRSQNVYDEGLRLDDVVHIADTVDEEMRASRVEAGDILLNITGASLGRTCIVPAGFPPANVNQHVCILRLSEPRLREYVAMALKSSAMKAQFDAAQTGAAREGLNYQQIAKLALAIPPESERREILKVLAGETSKSDALVSEAGHAIELLRERRTALISAAVTGEIDVRHIAGAEAA